MQIRKSRVPGVASCLDYPGLSKRKLHGDCGLASHLIVFLVAVSYSWQYGHLRWMSLNGCLRDRKASLSCTYARTFQPFGLYSTHMPCSTPLAAPQDLRYRTLSLSTLAAQEERGPHNPRHEAC